jgi:hypothetical protein
MDQGIIAQFKLFYRQQWISFMLYEYEANRDPNKTVTLLNAIQWSTFAWNQKVSSTTIEKCFWKSTCISKPGISSDSDIIEDCQATTQLQSQMALLPNISDLISVTEFVQPLDEQVIDDQDDIFDFIVESYSLDLDDQEEAIDNDIEAPKITISEAIKALDCLKLFELQQDIGERANISALERLERGLYQRKQLNYKQKTLESFLQG